MPEEMILEKTYSAVLIESRMPCVIVRFHGFANQAVFKPTMEVGH